MIFFISFAVAMLVFAIMACTCRAVEPKYRKIQRVAIASGCTATGIRVKNEVFDVHRWQDNDLSLNKRRALEAKRVQEYAWYSFEVDGEVYTVRETFMGGDKPSPKECKIYWEPGCPDKAITDMNMKGGAAYTAVSAIPVIVFLMCYGVLFLLFEVIPEVLEGML